MPDNTEKPSIPILPERLCSSRDGWFAYLFMVLWVLPILIVGLTNKTFPDRMLTGIGVPYNLSREALNFANSMYRVSCLFPKRVGSWGNYYYLVRLEGAKEWLSVPEEELSRLKPFGYRTRLKRMLDDARNDKTGKLRRQAMAEFIRDRYETRHPGSPRVAAVRFMRAVYLTGSDTIAKPAGHWQRPPYQTIPAEQLRLVSTHPFKEEGEE